MLLKTPKFWYTKTSGTQELPTHFCALSQILKPVSVLYQLGHRLNQKFTKRYKAPLPVICIGNVTAGGSGKTPTCISLSSLIKKSGLFSSPYFLTRGYGGNDTGPRHIEDHDTVHQVGDEPLLLASYSNTIISKNRVDGAKKAHDLGADVIIMDDGLQNMSIDKTLSFMVIDGSMGLGNQLTLPAGPLREPFSYALNRSDAIIIIGEDTYGVSHLIPSDKPIFTANILPDITVSSIPTDKPYFAFAGLGIPEKFYTTLRNDELEIVETCNFPDHYPYTENDISLLLEKAKPLGASLITTEKDYVRLSKTLQKQVYMYPVTLKWDNESSLIRFIVEKIENRNRI